MSIAIILPLIAIGFILGLIIGYIAAKFVYYKEPIGDLRIDESDPDDGPYLFLELNSRPNTFKHLKQVTLNVKAKNYISQK